MSFKREDGWETHAAGSRFHYVDDKLHNDNGPAIGPAIIWNNGNKAWWHNGKHIGNSEYGYSQESLSNGKGLG